MRLTSLRSKIFAFVLTVLVLGAGTVMVVTQRDVTQTVTSSEERAVDNILNLLARDSVARWASLLGQKAATARQARQPLIQYSALIASVLESHAQQVREGLLDAEEAQRSALEWVSRLEPGLQRHVVVLDDTLRVLSDSSVMPRGTSLAQRQDIKGRVFNDISRQELSVGQPTFVIFRNPPDAGPDASETLPAGRASEPSHTAEAHSAGELRYAALSRFQAWGWIIAVSDSAQHIVDTFEQQRLSMEAAVAETLASLRLAGSGFLFISDHTGRLLTPVPAAHTQLLKAVDPRVSPHPLADLLTRDPPQGLPSRFEFAPPSGTGSASPERWLIKTAFVKPLKWTLVAAVPARELSRPAAELRNRVGMLFLAGLVLTLGLAWVLSARITGPLRLLSDFARRLPERDLTLSEPMPLQIAELPQRHPDEVGDLAQAFIHMDSQLRDKVATLLLETSRRERFESELSIAREIQLGLLPTELAPRVLARLDVHATMIPAKEVGGDFFDYFMLPDGRLCFAIGDVSDKGVPAALFMAVTRTLLRTCAEDEPDPAPLMGRVNTRLASNNPNMMFVTLIIGVLDLESGVLAWANGGHPPPCILRPTGELRLLEGRSGPACGVQSGLAYRGFTATLEPGETLFAYTDGVSEAMNPHQEQYGEARMNIRLQQSAAEDATAQGHADDLLADVGTFVCETEQSDDITVIIIKRLPT